MVCSTFNRILPKLAGGLNVTLVVVLQHQVPQDLALGLREQLPILAFLALLLSYLLRSRHVSLSSPPRGYQYL